MTVVKILLAVSLLKLMLHAGAARTDTIITFYLILHTILLGATGFSLYPYNYMQLQLKLVKIPHQGVYNPY